MRTEEGVRGSGEWCSGMEVALERILVVYEQLCVLKSSRS
jgi:hypothetical protein